MRDSLRSSIGGFIVSGVFICILSIYWVTYDCPTCSERIAKQKISNILDEYGASNTLSAAEMDAASLSFADLSLEVDKANETRWAVVDISVHYDTSHLPYTSPCWLINPKGEWLRIPRNHRAALSKFHEGHEYELPSTVESWPRELTIEPQLKFDTGDYSAQMLRGDFCHIVTRNGAHNYIVGTYFFNTFCAVTPQDTETNRPYALPEW